MTATSGIKALRKVQLGRQTTLHTPVAATTIWRGPAITPNDERKQVRPSENVGLSALTTRQYTPQLYGTLQLPQTEATFQQILHLLEAGIKAVTPVADGVGTGFVSAYPLPYQDSNTTKLYTIEGGNNKGEEELEDAFALEITLSGKKNEAWMMGATFGGAQTTIASFTGALSIPTVSEMLFNKSKLFIDNVGGTLGSTQIVNSWLGATIKITTGLKAQFTAEGYLYPSFIDFVGAKCSVELMLLHNATTIAERALWRSNTPRQIRMLCEGNTLGTPGTYSKETFKADIAGLYTKFGPPTDEDEGSDAYKVTFDAGYDATAALFANFTVVHELSAVP